MSRVSIVTLHFMVKAEPSDNAFQSGNNSPLQGQIKLPPALIEQLKGQPGAFWKTACGLNVSTKPDLDGITLLATIVNCEKCKEYIAKNG